MRTFIILSLMSIAVFANNQLPSFNGRYRILCESQNYQYRECRLNEFIEEVFLFQQHSTSPCQFNRSWGYTRDSIWVDQGCRATFDVLTYSGRQTFDVTCSSDNYQYRFCPVGGFLVDVFLLQTHSRTPCIQGRNWGFMRDGVWVDQGCRATFRVTIDRY